MSVEVRHRAYRFRCYPDPVQEDNLRRTLGCTRLVYNKALDYRRKAYYRRAEKITYAQTSAMLTTWKKASAYDFLNEVSSVPLQQALRHLQKAYVNFWEQRTAYPAIKRKRFAGSAEYTRSAFTFDPATRRLKLAKHAMPLKVKWSRKLPKDTVPSTVTVTRDGAGRWFVSLLVEEHAERAPAANGKVGIDAGLTSLFTLSTGEKITNPRHERRDRARIRRRQKELSRKQKGSANQAKARLKLGRAHAKIADRRADLLHKLTTRLVRENQVIAIEDLNVRGMLGNHTLARAIADASWAEFRRMLEYKAERAGLTVIAVDRFLPSTKTCSACGSYREHMPLHQRVFTCPDPDCGHTEDRDVNAAKNILAAGLAVAACGDGVRHKRS